LASWGLLLVDWQLLGISDVRGNASLRAMGGFFSWVVTWEMKALMVVSIISRLYEVPTKNIKWVTESWAQGLSRWR